MSGVELFASVAALFVFILLTWRPPLGVAALVAFYPLQDVVPDTPVPGLNAETILVAYAMVLTLGRSGLRLPPLRITAPVLALVAVIVLAFLIGRTGIETYDPLGRTWFDLKYLKYQTFSALLFFIAFWWIRDPREGRRVLEGISVAISLVACVALMDLSDGVERISGLFPNTNTTGMVLGIFMLCPLHLVWFGDVSARRRIFHGGVYLIAGVVMVLTLSRGAWLAAVVGHFIWFMLVDRRVLIVGAATGMVALTLSLPLVPEQVRERIAHTFETGSTVYQVGGNVTLEGSAASRVVLHRVGLDMFLDSPIWGHGSNVFRLQSVRYGARYGLLRRTPPHSLPIKLATESGLLGIMALFWLALAVLALGMRLYAVGGVDRSLGILLVCVGMATGTANLTATDFLTSPVAAAFFWAVLGVATRRYFAPLNPA